MSLSFSMFSCTINHRNYVLGFFLFWRRVKVHLKVNFRRKKLNTHRSYMLNAHCDHVNRMKMKSFNFEFLLDEL